MVSNKTMLLRLSIRSRIFKFRFQARIASKEWPTLWRTKHCLSLPE